MLVKEKQNLDLVNWSDKFVRAINCNIAINQKNLAASLVKFLRFIEKIRLKKRKSSSPRFSTIFVLHTRVNPTTSFVPHRWPPISGHGKISRVFSVFSPWLRPRIGAKREEEEGRRSPRKEKGSFSKGCTPSFFSSSSIFHHLPLCSKNPFSHAAMDTRSGRLIDILPPRRYPTLFPIFS